MHRAVAAMRCRDGGVGLVERVAVRYLDVGQEFLALNHPDREFALVHRYDPLAPMLRGAKCPIGLSSCLGHPGPAGVVLEAPVMRALPQQ